MHDLTVVSAAFADQGEVSFVRCVGVSEFDKHGGVFYGLYTSGNDTDPESAPNYCLRKATWTTRFRKIENIIESFESKALFLNSENIDYKWRNLVAEIDTGSNAPITVFDQVKVSEKEQRTDKTFVFYGNASGVVLQGDYHYKELRNRYFEDQFKNLAIMFSELESAGSILPDRDSLRISYDFDRCSFLFR